MKGIKICCDDEKSFQNELPYLEVVKKNKFGKKFGQFFSQVLSFWSNYELEKRKGVIR